MMTSGPTDGPSGRALSLRRTLLRPRDLLPRAVSSGAPAAAFAIFVLFAIRAGLPFHHAAQAAAAVAVTQILPGALIWRIVRPVRGWWLEDVVMGFALGASLAVGVQTIAGTFGMSWIAWAGGPAFALALIVAPRTRSKIRRVRTELLPPGWNPAVAMTSLLLLVPTQTFYRRIPLEWSAGFRSFYPDMPFHLSLASQLAHRGPGEVPFVLGEPLDYHWFSHAWVAQTSLAANVPLDAVLFRVMPPLIAVFVVWAVATVSVRLSKRLWTGPLAGLMAVGAGKLDLFQGARPGSLVDPLSPSLGYSSLVVLSLIALLVMRWNRETSPASVLLVPALAFTLVGAKGSALPVVAAGVTLACLWSWFVRTPERGAITTDLLLVYGSGLVSYVLVFRGRTGGLHVDPVESLMTTGVAKMLLDNADIGILVVALAVVVRLISVLAPATGLAGALILPSLRRDPTIALLLGMSLAGAASVVILSQQSLSQWYFLRNAIPAMAIGSAIGISGLWDAVHERRTEVFGLAAMVGLAILVILGFGFPDSPTGSAVEAVLLRLLAAAAVLVAGCVIGAVSRPDVTAAKADIAAVVSASLVLAVTLPTVLNQAQERLPQYNQPVDPSTPLAFSRDQITAARWLRDHSGARDIVATNRHCAAPDWQNCDSRRFFVAAYTERRVLVEGWVYTRSWSEAPQVELGKVFKPFWDPERLRLNDSFLETPSGAEARALYEKGVRWLYVDKTAPYSEELGDYARPRYGTEWAQVFELDAADSREYLLTP